MLDKEKKRDHKKEENKVSSNVAEVCICVWLQNEFIKMNVCSLWPSFFIRFFSFRIVKSQVETDFSFDAIKLSTVHLLWQNEADVVSFKMV